MIDISKGRYWDEGVTLVDGCTPCSPGCDHCWSAAQAHRFKREGEPGHSSGILTGENRKFNGDIIVYYNRLERFRARQPKVFAIWNDLQHERVTDVFKDNAYDAMVKAKQHTFLILTKRPQVVVDYMEGCQMGADDIGGKFPWDNIWHGLTVCNQQEADEKIPIFLQVPGKKFLSIEPMLGPMNITPYIGGYAHICKCGWHETEMGICPQGDNWYCPECGTYCENYDAVDAIILGGETGSGERPMHPEWARSIRDQCAAAGIPFFFKQWGEWAPSWLNDDRGKIAGSEWMDKMGRNKAGRLLDGRTHDELPWGKR